jgi:propionyl-CoA synthetase
MNIHEKSRYHEVYARSMADPEGFWADAAREIDWIEPAKKIFDPAIGAYGRWFTGAVVNTCYNALDRHVAGGRADQVALIHDSPLTNTVSKFTYAEMLQEVQALAAVCRISGWQRDRIILYADGAGSGDAMLAWRGLAPCTRGVRRLCGGSWRRASTTPNRN